MAQATVQLMRHPELSKLDSLLAEEKGLLQGLDNEDDDDDDGGCSCIKQLTETLARRLKMSPAEQYVSCAEHIVLSFRFLCRFNNLLDFIYL